MDDILDSDSDMSDDEGSDKDGEEMEIATSTGIPTVVSTITDNNEPMDSGIVLLAQQDKEQQVATGSSEPCKEQTNKIAVRESAVESSAVFNLTTKQIQKQRNSIREIVGKCVRSVTFVETKPFLEFIAMTRRAGDLGITKVLCETWFRHAAGSDTLIEETRQNAILNAGNVVADIAAIIESQPQIESVNRPHGNIREVFNYIGQGVGGGRGKGRHGSDRDSSFGRQGVQSRQGFGALGLSPAIGDVVRPQASAEPQVSLSVEVYELVDMFGVFSENTKLTVAKLEIEYFGRASPITIEAFVPGVNFRMHVIVQALLESNVSTERDVAPDSLRKRLVRTGKDVPDGIGDERTAGLGSTEVFKGTGLTKARSEWVARCGCEDVFGLKDVIKQFVVSPLGG
ncbi:hypothetical protein M427DRAFT_48483 [Gonapodya prolifera JEL478]|uniref:Uncharacterized protein n=1 Tax=Gonapodya prolifera (strain JEL478) TaxID=1344416 RepID=A0A139A0N6_GONPJ|nr:hypothetical protein M427DRAFT_48483 [Gonapodya prolifera JEL478]|eukprot:KXS10188.1 hypothetical protein M427DRAFT_48483 [Gonapodya prolifera JEL478]